MVLVGVRPLRLLSGLSSPDTPTEEKTFEETPEILMRRRRSITATPPQSAPTPTSSPLLKDPPKRRIRSEELSISRLSVTISVNKATSRRELEVVVRHSSSRPPLVLVVELRRLLFLFTLLLALSSAHAFRVLPTAGLPPRVASSASPRLVGPRDTMTTLATVALDDAAEAAVESELAPSSSVSLRQLGLDEVAGQLGKAGAEVGADGGDVSIFGGALLHLLSGESLTVEKVKSYATRACLSAAMHKVIGGAVSVASCLAPHAPH